MNTGENKPLLSNNSMYSDKRHKPPSSESSSDNDQWSDGSSSSYYSDSDSYIPEWDSYVRDDGELIYIVSKSKNETTSNDSSALLTKSSDNVNITERGGFTRQSIRRSSKGKWLKILKRRNSENTTTKNTKSPSNDQASNVQSKKSLSLFSVENLSLTSNKVTFSENQEGELKEINIEVDFSNRIRVGRKQNLMEALIGISTITFGDGKRLMISHILSESQAANLKQIKIGDWLKEIDNKPVDADNIDQILNSYSESRIQIKLLLQRVAGAEFSNDSSVPVNSLRSDLIKHLADDVNEHELVISQVLRDLPVAIIYLTTDGLTENGPENEGVLYCYPRPEKYNFLCSCRGTFITLNHLIPDVFKNSNPSTCTLFAKDHLVNVIYTARDNDLMMLALPDKKCNLFELSLINQEVVRVLEFCYKSLSACFTPVLNVQKLDHLFSRLFTQILTCGYGWNTQRSVRIENIISLSELPAEPLFEQCLPIIQTVHLPWEARLQIDDALAELDATYISRNHQDVNMQDIFHIVGSCLYYAGHLLVSHLIQDEVMEIHSFLRMQGFLSISCDENLQNLIVWKEVFLSMKYEDDTQDTLQPMINSIPNYRTFLVIIGKGHFLLVALLRGMQNTKNVPPSPYFIEECESTLDLLVEVGLDKFLQRWFQSNLEPQVMLHPEELFSSTKYKDQEGNFGAFGKKSLPISKKSTEVHSILKKRQASTDELNVSSSDTQLSNQQANQWGKTQHHGNTGAPYPESEDSESQNSTSEISEERIQGRRAARDKENYTGRNSNSSDSCTEWDGCEANSLISGGYEFADLSQSLLQKMGILLPTKITAGNENVCFHFIRLESELGILLAPTVNVQKQSDSELYKHILTNFRRASQKIHTLLQNTIRYKRMLSPSSSVNKSLVAIKEHGILFEVPTKLTEQIRKNEEPFNYWVIGRLFEQPKFTEVYVCYHEAIPQNMVDIAFRLAFVT